MKNIVCIFSMILSVISLPSFAAVTTEAGHLASIVSRADGYHNIRISTAFPDMGCTLTDRGVIVEGSAGGTTMLNVALAALSTYQLQVKVGVEGCIAISADQPLVTAPRVIRVWIVR